MASKKRLQRVNLELSKSDKIKKSNDKIRKNNETNETNEKVGSYLEAGNPRVDASDDFGDEGEVRCFCNVRRETGEMVQCEVCSGWFHLKCLRMKEGVGVLNGRAFVCCFCLSVKVLELSRFVGELQGEMVVLRKSVKELKREKDELIERVTFVEGDWKKIERSGRLEEREKRMSVNRTGPGERKDSKERDGAKSQELSQCGNRRPGVVGWKKSDLRSRVSVVNSGIVKKNRCGEYVGVRKLWGTRKKVSVEDVKERLEAKFDEAEKVEVVRVIKEDSNRIRWWFWLMGEEEVLGRLDGTTIDEAWKVEKRSPFLGVASVRVLSR